MLESKDGHTLCHASGELLSAGEVQEMGEDYPKFFQLHESLRSDAVFALQSHNYTCCKEKK